MNVEIRSIEEKDVDDVMGLQKAIGKPTDQLMKNLSGSIRCLHNSLPWPLREFDDDLPSALPFGIQRWTIDNSWC